MISKVLYTAAHYGFGTDAVPLGGGAAIAYRLAQEWRARPPFDLVMVDPSILQASAPRDKDLVRYSEWDYARFCRRFEEAQTERVLRERPETTAVLVNDVSEGPTFRRLAERGFALWTIYHVDVVDYFCRMYLREWIRPETAARLYDRLAERGWDGLVPDVLKLVLAKHADSVRYSRGLLVPSQAMKNVLLTCYRDLAPERVHVVPWGIQESALDPAAVAQERERLSTEWRLRPDDVVLLSLSRISPEKRQDRLLAALAWWERQPDYPASGVTLLLCGEAAFMQGTRFERWLRAMASNLRRTRVHFVGYAAGIRKAALLQLASLYVFPSQHESYGLTLLEAMNAGLPAVACDSYGARDVLKPDMGILLPPASERQIPILLARAIARLASDPARRSMGEAARRFAQSQRFVDAAQRIASLLINE